MQNPKTHSGGFEALNLFKGFLAHRHLPVFLALGAILIMLPALKTGLVADDLMQRAVELRPSQLPSRMHETGNPADSGSFSTVLFDLFGLNRDPHYISLMKNYGTLPWWTPDGLKLSLFRPVAAFTHWLDYRLFSDSPALMHAHNIAWFAAVIFLLTIVYRKLMGVGWAAGLAALLFLLDDYTCFPVMFIANRGFVMALFFGLVCLYEHHQWRSTSSRSALALSVLFLALSLLSEEGGASTFAFILAYALVLDQGSFCVRVLTLLPSILVLIAWRTLYVLSGYGLSHEGLFYVDPLNEPFLFARELAPRMALVLGGQLSCVPPEILLAVKPSLLPVIIALYALFAVGVLAVFLPWMHRNKMARFWLAIMLLAAIPESSLVPLSKNFGFVAVGAYGLIASFIAGLITAPARLPESFARRTPAWIACTLLILAHVPGAIAERVVTFKGASSVFAQLNRIPRDWPAIWNQNVIVINYPCPLVSAYVPSYKAYFHQPLPNRLRMLAPACTSLDVQRTDAQTLVIQSHGRDLFTCDDVGSVHIAYLFSACNLLLDKPHCKKGDRYHFNGLIVDVLETDEADLPSRVAFRFDTSLNSSDFRWFWFDWRTFSVPPFKIPAIGQSVTLSGPQQETAWEVSE